MRNSQRSDLWAHCLYSSSHFSFVTMDLNQGCAIPQVRWAVGKKCKTAFDK